MKYRKKSYYCPKVTKWVSGGGWADAEHSKICRYIFNIYHHGDCAISVCYTVTFLQLKDLSEQKMFPTSCTYIIHVERHRINLGREYLYYQCVIVILLI